MPRLVKAVATDPALSQWLNGRSRIAGSAKLALQGAAYTVKRTTLVPLCSPSPVDSVSTVSPNVVKPSASQGSHSTNFSAYSATSANPEQANGEIEIDVRNVDSCPERPSRHTPGSHSSPHGRALSQCVASDTKASCRRVPDQSVSSVPSDVNPEVQHGRPADRAQDSAHSDPASNSVWLTTDTERSKFLQPFKEMDSAEEGLNGNGKAKCTADNLAAEKPAIAEEKHDNTKSATATPASTLSEFEPHPVTMTDSSEPMSMPPAPSDSRVQNELASSKSAGHVSVSGEGFKLSDETEARVDFKRAMEYLHVPVFRRGRFVLGEILGVGSPATNMVKIYFPERHAPVSIARRFVADLGVADCMKYIEYEWFEGQILVVTRHSFFNDGRYVVYFSVFGPDGKSMSKYPSQTLVRASVHEAQDCPICYERDTLCTCQDFRMTEMFPVQSKAPWSWTQWVTVFNAFQSRSTTGYGSMVFKGKDGDVETSFIMRHRRRSYFGEAGGARAHLLCRQYASLALMKDLYPTTDNILEDGTRCYLTYNAEDFDVEEQTSNASAYHPPVAGEKEDFFATGDSRSGHSASLKARSTMRKRYSCSCGLVFSHLGHYNAHTRAVHMKLKPHQCSKCSMAFAKGSDLRRHAVAVHGMPREKRLFSCDDCNSEFRLGSQLALHRRFVHDGRATLFECPASGCDCIFATRQGLRKHRLAKHS